MDFTTQVFELSKLAEQKIKDFLDTNNKIVFTELDEEEGDMPDEFYELPTAFVSGKYDYTLYVINELYKEDGEYYATGVSYDFEGEYTFTVNELPNNALFGLADLLED